MGGVCSMRGHWESGHLNVHGVGGIGGSRCIRVVRSLPGHPLQVRLRKRDAMPWFG